MINLGDSVRDEITGFEGVVLARTEYLYEATILRVHARKLNDGKIQEPVWLEEDRLEVIKESDVVGFRSIKGRVEAER
jgi:hypothetical protein